MVSSSATAGGTAGLLLEGFPVLSGAARKFVRSHPWEARAAVAAALEAVAAQRLEVSRTTVYEWARTARLVAWRTTKRDLRPRAGIHFPRVGLKPPTSSRILLQREYDRSAHCVHYHRFHIVRARRYRHRVLTGDPGLRVRAVRRQVRRGNGVSILHGALPGDHAHMSVSVPPRLAISDPVRRTEGRSSHRIRRGFPEIRKRYWGRRFRGRGHFPATTGTITDGPVLGILTGTSLTLPVPAGGYSRHPTQRNAVRPECFRAAARKTETRARCDRFPTAVRG